MELKFVETCAACPEQYDVFDEEGNYVAYIRLRWGYLSCETEGPYGEEIYSASIGDDGWAGCFENEEQRKAELQNCENAILKWYADKDDEYE